MSETEEGYYWGNDPYWTEALERFLRDKEAGERTITLDLGAVEEAIYNSDSPAFRLMDALASVKEHEGWDGYRGTPRLIFALLQHLKERSR